MEKLIQVFYYVNVRMETNNDIERFNPDFKQGLSKEQVSLRKQQKLTNKKSFSFGKSYLDILLSNALNLFNLLLFAIIGVLVCFRLYVSILFAVVLFFNIGIGTYFDLRNKRIISKAKLVNPTKVTVVRDGKMQEIKSSELVLDDIVLLENNSYVCADCLIVEGKIGVNESLINGESKDLYKDISNEVLAGSFVTSGVAFARVNEIGESGFAGSLKKDANKIKRPLSSIHSSLKRLLFVIAIITLVITVFMVLTFLFQSKFKTDAKSSFESIAGSVVTMVPTGLYLLSITALAVSSVRLSKNDAVVLDYYSMEMLARADMLCIDKTGTLTDGSLAVKKVISLRGDYTEIYIVQAVSNVLCATQDRNIVAKALKNYFALELSSGVVVTLPFNGTNKYSGATFKGDKTFLIGSPEDLPLSNKAGVIKRCEEFTKNGYRVVILGEGRGLIANNTYSGIVEAVALIVLREHVREEVNETLTWFKNRGAGIKVISGDDLITTVAIATEIGVDGSDKYISLEGKSLDEIKELAFDYNVFGMATAEQKEFLVKALRESGKTVAMIGDGANDVLAFKQADCSITTGESVDIAKNASQIVLVDSNFETLRSIVEEGQVSANNIQKITSLFMTKTIIGAVLTLVFILASIITANPNTQYPFVTNNLYVLEIVICGYAVASFIFDNSQTKLKGGLISNTLKNAIPASIMIIGSVLVIFWLYILQLNYSLNLSIYNTGTAISMSSIAITVLSFVYLYKMCSPFNKLRKITFIVASSIGGAIILTSAILSYVLQKPEPVLSIPFVDMSGPAYLTTIIIIIVFALIYLITYRFVAIFKGDKNHEN